MKLPVELRNSKSGLINIKNNDQKCFSSCHVRILILLKYIQEELNEKIKNLLMILIMMELGFLCKKKLLARLKQKSTFALMCFVKKIGWLFQFMFHIKYWKSQ